MVAGNYHTLTRDANMGLSEQDKRDIAEIVATTLKSGCVCGLSHEAQGEMGHFMGMVRDVGGGSHSKGIEVLRENLSFFMRYKRRGEKIGLAIVTLFTVSMVSGFIYIVKKGLSIVLMEK